MSALTHKQGGLLWHTTGRKFWEPGTQPAPTTAEASALIKLIMEYIKEKNQQSGAEAVSMVRKWFEDFELSEIHWRFGGKKKPINDKQQPELPTMPEEPKPETAKTEPKHETPKAEKPVKAPKEEKKAKEVKREINPGKSMTSEDEILALIEAGVKNIWLYGPAGCGKTTIVKNVANRLSLPCTALSCNEGTSPGEILGYKFPEPHHSPISNALAQPGLVLIDDATLMEAGTAGAMQSILANGEFTGPAGHVKRPENCIIICTANTNGGGADRLYTANNQWDGATMDRFAGAMIAIDYSEQWETENTDPEVRVFVLAMRSAIQIHELRRIASTRTAITGSKLKEAGFTNWRDRLTVTWTQEEKRLL